MRTGGSPNNARQNTSRCVRKRYRAASWHIPAISHGQQRHQPPCLTLPHGPASAPRNPETSWVVGDSSVSVASSSTSPGASSPGLNAVTAIAARSTAPALGSPTAPAVFSISGPSSRLFLQHRRLDLGHDIDRKFLPQGRLPYDNYIDSLREHDERHDAIVNRTGTHGVSIVRWSGHDCVTMSHSCKMTTAVAPVGKAKPCSV